MYLAINDLTDSFIAINYAKQGKFVAEEDEEEEQIVHSVQQIDASPSVDELGDMAIWQRYGVSWVLKVME